MLDTERQKVGVQLNSCNTCASCKLLSLVLLCWWWDSEMSERRIRQKEEENTFNLSTDSFENTFIEYADKQVWSSKHFLFLNCNMTTSTAFWHRLTGGSIRAGC